MLSATRAGSRCLQGGGGGGLSSTRLGDEAQGQRIVLRERRRTSTWEEGALAALSLFFDHLVSPLACVCACVRGGEGT